LNPPALSDPTLLTPRDRMELVRTIRLLFIAAVGVVIVVARRAKLPQPVWAWRVPAYGIGAVAALWTIERVAGFWS